MATVDRLIVSQKVYHVIKTNKSPYWIKNWLYEHA